MLCIYCYVRIAAKAKPWFNLRRHICIKWVDTTRFYVQIIIFFLSITSLHCILKEFKANSIIAQILFFTVYIYTSLWCHSQIGEIQWKRRKKKKTGYRPSFSSFFILWHIAKCGSVCLRLG